MVIMLVVVIAVAVVFMLSIVVDDVNTEVIEVGSALNKYRYLYIK